MPKIHSVTLSNFKGIEELTIDLDDRVNCPVITLIGLNESGKTTILEGLSHFVSGDNSLSSLFQGIHTKSTGTGLIPVHKKAAFTDSIEIKAVVQLDAIDVERVQKIADKYKLTINKTAIQKSFSVTKKLQFEDSVFKTTNDYWTFELIVKSKTAKNEKKYTRPESGKNQPDLWLEIVRHLEANLPRISYFPTFLVDMPRKIYLKSHKNELPVNRYYRDVFQDILDSMKENLSLEKHVCDRIDSYKEGEKDVNWFSLFFGSTSKGPIDSVFQKISNTVTKEVLGSWQRVFQRTISAKGIQVEWNIDSEKDDIPYASFYVTDGESRYAISERSLGFRWFFSFLLFTAFKQTKERPNIFIFDEPAANLHAKAQAELMTSFSRIVADGNRIIYSTHSHHMINPQWLAGAYIVENMALDYDADDAFGLNIKPTKISASKYRDFVSQYPTRSSYFQPVVEKLEYVTPEIIGRAPFIVVEGISDYYALKLAITSLKLKTKYSLMPGVGAGASGPLISFLMGRGEKFILLLDDDLKGKKEKTRYVNEWYLPHGSILTLGDVAPELKDKYLESLITDDTTKLIKEHFGIETSPTKKQIGWYLAEMCSTNPRSNTLGKETLSNLKKVLQVLGKMIEDLK